MYQSDNAPTSLSARPQVPTSLHTPSFTETKVDSLGHFAGELEREMSCNPPKQHPPGASEMHSTSQTAVNQHPSEIHPGGVSTLH